MKAISAIIAVWSLIIGLAAEAPKGEEWKPLFNGKDLTGFETRNGTATFVVKDGVIFGRTSPGSENTFLITCKHFTDFELAFEVMVDKGPNIKTFINGKQVADQSLSAFYRNFESGSIEFQAHRIPDDKGPFEARWRNIYLREL